MLYIVVYINSSNMNREGRIIIYAYPYLIVIKLNVVHTPWFISKGNRLMFIHEDCCVRLLIYAIIEYNIMILWKIAVNSLKTIFKCQNH